MLTAFAQEHVGDEILARCMILSMASQAVKNSDGLHVSVTGDSGKGKTHAFRKMMRQVPDRYKVKGTVSNKALYYMKDLQPRTVLMSDDTELSDGIQEILKSATSNFHEPITHTTVTKDLTSRVCTIPERCVWWIAKKEGTGDDQVMNRMLTCWIDESAEQDARVLAAKQAREMLDPDSFVDESDELEDLQGDLGDPARADDLGDHSLLEADPVQRHLQPAQPRHALRPDQEPRGPLLHAAAAEDERGRDALRVCGRGGFRSGE